MSYERRDFAGAAPLTTLVGTISNSDMTLEIANASGWPTGSAGDFFIVIDRGNVGEEKIRCASRSGTSITVQTSGRAADETIASTHQSGVNVEHCITAIDADEANAAVFNTVGKVTTIGDTIVASGANAFQRIAKGTSGQFYKQGASIPAWTSLASTDISDLAETIRDTIGTALTAGTNITLTVNDAGDTITVTAASTAASISDFTEAVQDVVGALGLGGNGLTFTYTDASNTAVIAVNVDDSTIEISGDALRVKDSGITSAKIADGTIVNADIADATITLAKLANTTAWTSFTPTIGGSGWSVGNGTLACSYQQIGKTVAAHYSFTLGSTSASGSGTLTFTLPVTAVASRYTGQGYTDMAGNGVFHILVRATSTTVLEFDVGGSVTTAMLGLSIGSPATWANGHIIIADIVYQAT
jgi:hypothetical protein